MLHILKSKCYLLSLICLALLVGLFLPKTAFAAIYTLSGHVQNSSSTAITGATVDVKDSSSNTTIASTTTDNSGDYNISFNEGTYNVQITPVSGSGYSGAVALNQVISGNKTLNFILVSTGSATLSGHIYDPRGNPLQDQKVILSTSGGIQITATTDSNGNYSLQANTGTYQLQLAYPDNGNSFTTDAPERYTLSKSNFSLSQSTIIDFTLPAKEVDLHVQDSSGTAIIGAQIQVPQTGVSNQSIGGGITASGTNDYGIGGFPQPTTDSNGNVTLWLFANTSSNPYTFNVTPPSGSSSAASSTTGIVITADTPKTIILPPAYTLSGHIYDASGHALVNQNVILKKGSSILSTTTDNSGFYSLQAVANTYTLQIAFPDSGNNFSTEAPERYTLNVSNYSLTQNTTQDLTIPAKEVDVHIQDAAGSPIINAQIQVPTVNVSSQVLATNVTGSGSNDYGIGGFPQPTTDSSGNAKLWLLPNTSSTPYTINITPPSGSNFASTSVKNIVVTGITPVPIILQQPVTLSGHIYDESGVGVAGQTVFLEAGSTQIQTTTGNDGSYSLNANTGTYSLTISAQGNSFTTNAPERYNLTVPNYSLTQTTSNFNLNLPIKKITLHVQDNVGNSISNASVQVPTVNLSNLPLGNNLVASGFSDYGIGGFPQPQTDSSGNVILWLFTNNVSHYYSVNVTPQNGSIFSPFTLSNLLVEADLPEIVALQYNHATPVTTASLATDHGDSTYSDPTTVTLSASAAAGYTLQSPGGTFYTIDGGNQQTYSAPFTVTGTGSHTITYWSVDDSGVQESHNSKKFTILATYSLSGTVYNDADQNGFQDQGETGFSGVTVSLDSGQSTTTNSNGDYTFSNLQAGTYVETLTVPTNYTATTTNPATISLATDTTQNFGIAPAGPTLVTAIDAGGNTQGDFVADTEFNGGSTYSSSTSVDTSEVDNPAPQTVYQTVRYGNFTYTIPGLTPGGTYTVRLHFNELYWGTNGSNATGDRKFNVSANGTQVLTNYDIFDHAGGANKAIVEQIPATADSNGTITLQFSTVTDNAMVNGIEVYNGTLPPIPTPTPVTSVAINTGGNATGSFIADTDHFGGTFYTSNENVDTSGITNPAPESVYQSVRYGNFTYIVPTHSPNTSYHVRLHFNELYWGTSNSGNQGGDGSRVFNVTINGTQVLNNFDIYQTAGRANKAVVENFDTTTDANGKITIGFSTVTDNAMVNAIEISKN